MRASLCLFLAFLMLSGASAAWAQGHVRERVRAGEVQPLDRILPQIRDDYPGSFYDAEGPMPGPDGLLHYRIKWLTPDGHIVWFNADARSGRILGVEGAPRFFGYPRPRFGGPPPRVLRGPRGWHGGFGGPGRRHGR